MNCSQLIILPDCDRCFSSDYRRHKVHDQQMKTVHTLWRQLTNIPSHQLTEATKLPMKSEGKYLDTIVLTSLAMLVIFLCVALTIRDSTQTQPSIHHQPSQALWTQQDTFTKTLLKELHDLNTAIQKVLSQSQSSSATPPTSLTTTIPIKSEATTSFEAPTASESTACSCNTTGTKIASIDMTDPTQNCPAGFRQVNRTESPLRTCGRPEGTRGCVSTSFSVNGMEYSHVCGRIVAYQVGTPEAFVGYSWKEDINGCYLDGISITHGQSPRQHIWSFVTAVSEGYPLDRYACPCHRNKGEWDGAVPPFVGRDYFCDTAGRGSSVRTGSFYGNDPLWDGQGCGGTSTCCEYNNPPWFCKQLPQPTTDDVELRLCDNGPPQVDDSPFEVIEIYIR